MATPVPKKVGRRKAREPQWEQRYTDDGVRLAVAYTRVSTKMQGAGGLGMQAQRYDISTFADAVVRTPNGDLPRYRVVKWFSEVKSGKHNNGFEARPALKEAFGRAMEIGATVIVSKVDRITRSPLFMEMLIQMVNERKGNFVVVQIGEDFEDLALRMMTAVAAEELKFITARVSAAMKQAKSRGVQIGCPAGLSRRLALKADPVARTKDERAVMYYHEIAPLRDIGLSWRSVAEDLNQRQVLAPTGAEWTESNVAKCYARGRDALRQIEGLEDPRPDASIGGGDPRVTDEMPDQPINSAE